MHVKGALACTKQLGWVAPWASFHGANHGTTTGSSASECTPPLLPLAGGVGSGYAPAVVHDKGNLLSVGNDVYRLGVLGRSRAALYGEHVVGSVSGPSVAYYTAAGMA